PPPGHVMPISEYLRAVRATVGHALLLVPSVTGLVRDDAGRVLLVRHSNGGVWVAPGGAVDPDERPADPVVREVREPLHAAVAGQRPAGNPGTHRWTPAR